MKLKNHPLLILFIIGICHFLPAQNHFILKKDFDKIEIPFTYVNGLLVIKVHYNASLYLWFVFDTGAENTILVHKEIAAVLDLKYLRQFRILGADLSTELIAYLTIQNQLEFGELKIINHPVLVLDDDYFNFKEKIGLDIHGILGADIFKRFIVQINYRNKTITLHNPEKFKLPRRQNYQTIPLEIIKNKPYIKARIDIQKDTFFTQKRLLLDTGSATSLLLQTNSHKSLALPRQVIKTPIGFGLGGELQGYFGRIHDLKIGSYHLGSVPTIFQKLPAAYDDKKLIREGLIGNEVMSHFHVIIDYISQQLYLAPNKNFDDEFAYDKSGLTLISGGRGSAFYVSYVVPNSPAAIAGVQIGDQIMTINRIPVNFYGLGEVTTKLKKKTGKKIRLRVKRKKEIHIVTFRLKDLI